MILVGLWLAACAPSPPPPQLSVDEVAGFVRPGTADAVAWASAVHRALLAAERPVDADHVCQTLAIIEQESGYAADPAVPNLGDIARRELVAKLSAELGVLGDDAAQLVLDQSPPGASQTFGERLDRVRTERELDLFFQDLLAFHEAKAPAVGKTIRFLFPRRLEAINPVATAGSMQVAVAYAQEHPMADGRSRDDVRAELYTLEGGVLFGTLRLFDHDADYDQPIYRFADFNAGQYASRNAAFQEQLAKVAGEPLTLDGDLLAYTDRGAPIAGQTVEVLRAWAAASGHDPDDLVSDLRDEKSRDFEDTDAWALVREAHRQTAGEPAYARVPAVALDSPKLKGDWTTQSFAERVHKRYRDCLTR